MTTPITVEKMMAYIDILNLQNGTGKFPVVNPMHTELDLKKINEILVLEGPQNCPGCIKGGAMKDDPTKVIIII